MVVTSAITVVPVETAPASSAPSTLTLHTTVTPTIQVTFTETLIGPTKLTNSSAPTASLYTGLASGGWNATSTANGVSPGALGTAVSVNTPMAQSASEVYTSTANGVSAINTIEATLVTNSKYSAPNLPRPELTSQQRPWMNRTLWPKHLSSSTSIVILICLQISLHQPLPISP